jgi:recombinational DNA repair protein (RecF pathway)
MREYIDDAIVLNKRELGAQDARYSLFTKRFGKMVAKGKSVRKLTSKLAGHLEPGSLVRVRLIEQHGLQVVDALREAVIINSDDLGIAFKNFALLSRLLAENEPEPLIWAMVCRGVINWNSILKTLGWDPFESVCSSCDARPVASFLVSRQDFFCERCAARIPSSEMVVL